MFGWPKPQRALAGKRVIVTGASGGIGRALAIQLAGAGAQQVLLARSGDALELVREEIAPHRVELIVGDVTDPAVRAEALARAAEKFGGLDLLVNNAGAGAYGRFVDSSPDRLRRLMEVNLFAPAEFLREAMPMLGAGDDPAVVNVGSILGCRGVPFSSEYNATKFALHGLSESIRPELAKRGVALLVAAPGSTETGFRQNVIDQTITPPWMDRRGTPASSVAAAIVSALKRRRRFIIPSNSGWWMVAANRAAPWALDAYLDRWG